jgi:glutamine amidotransferase
MSKPFLGICIGLQMLCDSSEEGNVEGLGIVAGTVRRFPSTTVPGNSGQRFKVPHMGWNQVHQAIEHPLWKDISSDARFYFVHSYYVETTNPESAAATTHYPFSFTSAVAKDNIFAVQFHPEKSHDAGLTLLNNFVRWEPFQFQEGIVKSTRDLFPLQT